MSTARVFYGNEDDAGAAVETLRAFGLRVVCIAATVADVREGSQRVEWEVIALDLPAQQPDTARAVEPSVASEPAETEQDEYWKGTSRWDDQWERDQERRHGYD